MGKFIKLCVTAMSREGKGMPEVTLFIQTVFPGIW